MFGGIKDVIAAIKNIQFEENQADMEAAVSAAIDVAELEFLALESQIDDQESELDDLRAEIEENQNAYADAIHEFLDCVDRPVGQLRYIIPEKPSTDRAILGLFDAINRNP